MTSPISPPAPDPKALLSIEAASKRLGVSRRTLYSRIALGHVRVVRLGGRVVRIDPEDLDGYVASRKSA